MENLKENPETTLVSNLVSNLVSKIDKRDPIVYQAFDIFKDFFKDDWRNTRVSEIIDGENIKVNEENIRIDSPIDENFFSEKEQEQVNKLFELFCTKKPYGYQLDTVKKILEMERKQSRIYKDKEIVSNGYQISLAIGSGKSLVMEFLSLFYPSVPIHPIIVSTDGKSIPEFDQLPFEKYPFYYENCAYIKDETNAVMAVKTELQRNCTVILTYQHLIPQMQRYFKEDWKSSILNKKKIAFIDNYKLKDDFDVDNYDILVVVADESNVNKLINLSYIKPFARIIIDDYTNMNDLPYLRQILTFSFIPVSGSGFEKNVNEIPSSYYSLRNINSELIKVVGDPDKVYEGVIRSNILTGEIMTSMSDFDVYGFIAFIEDYCRRLPGCENGTPSSLFNEIRENPKVENFIKYAFFIQNLDSFKTILPVLINDISVGEVESEKVSYFIDWFNNTKDLKFKSLMCSPSSVAQNNNSIINTIVNSKCIICQKPKDETYGFGIVSGCCGAFICSNCVDKAATHEIINSSSTNESLNQRLIDHSYYCVSCRAKDPNYYFNSRQYSSNSEMRAYSIARRYFDSDDLETHYPIDYYFKMIKDGFKLKNNQCNGAPINIRNDIEQGIISEDVFSKNIIPEINKIKSADILFPQLISCIHEVYKQMNIKPESGSVIMIYKCKDILKSRINDLFESMKREPDSPFQNCILYYIDSISHVIGMQLNLAALLVYDDDNEEHFSKRQLIGRIYRLSGFHQKLPLYIRNNKNAYK